jgi:hypothetical protein
MVHRTLAWTYVVLVLLVVGVTLAGRIARRPPRTPSRNDTACQTSCALSGGQRGATNAEGQSDIYDSVEPLAHRIKAISQMIIAVAAVCVVGWQFLDTFPSRPNAAAQLLDGIGVGLAAAAVVELAYTLFTSGPDEALDPLMLGLSAAILIKLGELSNLTVDKAAALLLLGVLLAVLFATRLLLAERHGRSRPQVWWVNRSGRQQGARSPMEEPRSTESR